MPGGGSEPLRFLWLQPIPGLAEGERWQVKEIEVKDTVLVEKDGVEEPIGGNQSTSIPLGCKPASRQ